MKVWLVTIGEPVPVGIAADDRLHRTGCLAKYLAANGHAVTWWTSTFNHFRKQHLTSDDESVQLGSGLEVRMLRGCGYRSNMSASRLLDHVQIARKFAARAGQASKPDIILAALPTIELSQACVEYGLQNGVPVVLDMRDMWPDIFVDAVPRAARPITRVLLQPLFVRARKACAGATAIIGITEEFVAWGLRRADRIAGPFDCSFPFAYETLQPSPEAVRQAEGFWDGLGVRHDQAVFTVCFFGGIGNAFDLGHVIEAAKMLKGEAVRFVLCGSGDGLVECRRKADSIPNVLLPGWVNAAQIRSLMQRSNAGLDPLPQRYDYLATVNNKAVEYFSAGLPVISSPRSGVLFDLLSRAKCGVSYDSQDATGLAVAVRQLRKDPEGCLNMEGASKRLFESAFELNSVCCAMVRHLETILQCATAS
jgi:glycosyltransferase involved in cell wall biosynthesis